MVKNIFLKSLEMDQNKQECVLVTSFVKFG